MKAKPIPNFDRLQRSFQESLDRNKQSKQLTETKPFKFDQAHDIKKGHRTKASLRTYIDEENDSKGFNRQHSKSYNRSLMHNKPKINPKTTKKQSAYEKNRRKDLDKKMRNDLMKVSENRQRYDNQNRLKAKVQNAYAAIDNTKQKELENKNKLQQKIDGMKKSEENNKNTIKECINKGRNNPLLIERYEKSKMDREKYFEGLKSIQMVRDSMLKEGLDPSKIMTPEQKELLADAEFFEKHRKNPKTAKIIKK